MKGTISYTLFLINTQFPLRSFLDIRVTTSFLRMLEPVLQIATFINNENIKDKGRRRAKDLFLLMLSS